MNRRRIVLYIGGIILGLWLGFVGSTVSYRLQHSPQDFVMTTSGELGQTPVLTLSGKPHFDEHSTPGTRSLAVDRSGQGREITEKSPVVLSLTAFHVTARATPEEHGRTLIVNFATPNALSRFYSDVIGQREGSRLIVTEPESEYSAVVSVIDILPTSLPQEHAAIPAHDGMPAVDIVSGIPTITAGGGPVSELVYNSVITGKGAQIGENDAVVVNYVLADANGQVRENTWQQGKPALLNMPEVFPGLRDALLDARVGSRIVVAIPSRLAQGGGDRALVVDILAAAPAAAD
ncbi:FKBP-type peptidyl-prolyl cis-trans isomerase [Trueperella sp. LYQ143]|uniref:FKBP-type peptidyl-prolyl cis-trans isomerase n=1 Tax=Trueperella sp. LYQ143 TaxID=3391059 RepID=UPI00398359A4